MSSNGSCYICDVYGTPWVPPHDAIADVSLLHSVLHNVNIRLKAHVTSELNAIPHTDEQKHLLQ